MSDSLNRNLDHIRVKCDHLIELCEALKEQNDLLNLENESLKVALETSQEKGRKVNQKLNALTLARSLTGSDEKNLDIKDKINEFVQEIDRCITLLNK